MELSESFLLSFAEKLKADILASLHVCCPGTVVSYDADTQTATVQPGLIASGLTAPELASVPVLLPSGSTDPSEGDPCLLIFADFCTDAFLSSGSPATPPVVRSHDWSDAFALVGLKISSSESSSSES